MPSDPDTDDVAQLVLGKLDRVAGRDGQWTARCPAHEDHTPSLSVSIGTQGDRVLLHCHAGCNVTDICDAIGVTTGDLYAHRNGTRPDVQSQPIEYVYRDHHGPYNKVTRHPGKQFRQSHWNGTAWSSGLGDHTPILYRLDELVGNEVWIAEGEKDVDTLGRHGRVATCCPMGAGKWHKLGINGVLLLAGRHVRIVVDRDVAGYRHGLDVHHHLDGVAASITVLASPTGKDVTDHLDVHHLDLDDLQELSAAELERLAGGEIDATVDDEDESSTFDPVDLRPYLEGTKVRVQADCLTMTDGRSLLHKARLNGVHGDSGTGKSWLMALLIRELISAGEVAMLVDLEDTADPLIDRLRQLGVADQQIVGQLVFFNPDDPFNDTNVARLIGWIDQRNATHMIVDSVGEAFSLEGVNENLDVEVAPWLRRVCRRIIAATAAGITLVDHGTKSAEKPLDPSGSKRKKAAITGTAWLMTSDEPFTKATGGRATLTCAKDRHGQYRRGDRVARFVMGAVDAFGHSTLTLTALHTLPVPAGAVDPDDEKRRKARQEIDRVMRAARKPLARSEIAERSSGVGMTFVRAEILALIDDGILVEVGERKHPTNGTTVPLYLLSKHPEQTDQGGT
jgi:hypothetical protein